MNEEPVKKKKFMAGFIVVLACAFVMQFIIFKKPSFDKVMINTAAQLNKNCPVMSDKDTRLDSASALPNKTFKYHYTLVNMNKDSVDVELYQLSIQPAILNNVRNNVDLALFRKHATTFVYDFKDKNNKHLFEITVTPGQYQVSE